MKEPNTPIELIVGLGNPGPDYHTTRHNAGQDFVTLLAQQQQHTLTPTAKFFGMTARYIVNGRELRTLVPTTFMNRSGQAVAAMCQFYKISPENVLVVHDELDLEPGVARLKISGGHGGHNGLRDIISALGNCRDFGRLRLGIGHPGNAAQVVSYVLKRPPGAEQIKLDDAMHAALCSVPDLTTGNWEKAMRELHSQTK
ncbi:MAG: PTH1 family peptidyl-tRNA hydrolase [Lentisphaeria bacterium]|jgi:PTH1 family peptidyl-tRNA hydrolase